MKAKELLLILEQHPEAEIRVINGIYEEVITGVQLGINENNKTILLHKQYQGNNIYDEIDLLK